MHIVKRQIAIFLKKYKEAKDNDIVCQAYIRHWLPIYYIAIEYLSCIYLFIFTYILSIVYHLWWNKGPKLKCVEKKTQETHKSLFLFWENKEFDFLRKHG